MGFGSISGAQPAAAPQCSWELLPQRRAGSTGSMPWGLAPPSASKLAQLQRLCLFLAVASCLHHEAFSSQLAWPRRWSLASLLAATDKQRQYVHGAVSSAAATACGGLSCDVRQL